LVVSRALAELFSHEILARETAFRGGTALHKLHLESAGRYSEDIDLVQVNAGQIGPVMDAIRSKLDGWLGAPRWKQGQGRVTFYYSFESEVRPVTPLKLKVEINTREHHSFLGLRRKQFAVESPWYTGAAEVLTYEVEELLATKLRALYQRKKGRDLFDLSLALTQVSDLDSKQVVSAFRHYLGNEGGHVTRELFERNVSVKLRDAIFLGDTPPLLPLGVEFNPELAFGQVRSALISKLPEGRRKRRRT
jgi:predicted nucleotidyltransferase component of viral defense system